MKKKLKGFVEAGQLGIFAKAYWGHPAYKLPPEANLMAVSHYLEALEWQRDVVKLHTIFGGKNPHPMFLVGGVPNPIDLNSDSAVNASKLAIVQNVIDRMRSFVDQVYVPDTIAVASFYKDWFERGEGLGNFLTFGDFPSAKPGTDLHDPASWWIPPGAIVDRDLSTVHEVDMADPSQVQEFVAHSRYDYEGGNEQGLHPWEGQTHLDYEGRGGPKTSYQHVDVEQGYSWLKPPAGRARPWKWVRCRACWSCAPRAMPPRANWSTALWPPWAWRNAPCSPPSAGPPRAPWRAS